jgi:hypothetical protein
MVKIATQGVDDATFTSWRVTILGPIPADEISPDIVFSEEDNLTDSNHSGDSINRVHGGGCPMGF